MNFFEHQFKARRKTLLLLSYFVLAVLMIIAAINAGVYFALYFADARAAPTLRAWFDQPYWQWISLGVTGLIALGSLLSFLRLRGGGTAVAEMVGARKIAMNSTAPEERRLINVVEEMSIAAGAPVPVLYVMDGEGAINAFVAGYRVNQAVLVVTKGALQQLSRDELQGVIGHEYSHILNGDMRINVRLIAALAGVLLIGQIGGFLLRSLRHSGRGSGGRGNSQAAILAFGLVLFSVGYVGLFFGRLIKAGISRQREFLADASAVQFTRNPDGIAGALWKIGHHAEGSRLRSSHAEDMSHMCFGESLKFGFTSLLSTHPPLDVRIQRIDPYYRAKRLAAGRGGEAAQQPGVAPASPAAMGFAGGAGAAIATSAERLTNSVGNPTAAHMDYARQLYAALPAPVVDSIHDRAGARAAVYALVLAGTDRDALKSAAALIRDGDSEDSFKITASLLEPVRALDARCRLPVFDLALPALKELSAQGRRDFLQTVEALIKSDQRFSLFEFVLFTLLTRSLEEAGEDTGEIKYLKFDAVMSEIRVVLSLLARVGAADEDAVRSNYENAMRAFTPAPGAPLRQAECSPGRLTLALRKLEAMSPFLKRSFIKVCADCVVRDGRVVPVEAELLRATAVSLDCPMPPLLQDSPPGLTATTTGATP